MRHQLHIECKRRIAAVIKITFSAGDDKTHRIATITAIRQATAVLRYGTFYGKTAKIPLSPHAYRMNIINPLFNKPFFYFHIAYYFCTGLGSNAYAVGYMILVPMAQQYKICLNSIYIYYVIGQIVLRYKRVKKQYFASYAYAKTGMAVIC